MDPPDFTAGDVLAADELDVMSEDIRYLYGLSQGTTFSAVQVSRSTNQSIADSTAEEINFTTENFDAGGWYPGSGTTITVPAAAIPDGATSIGVLCFGSLTFDTESAGRRRIRILKNGSSIGAWKVTAINGDTTDIQLTEATTVEEGDELELEAYQTSGGGCPVTNARFTVVRVGVAS